MDLIVLEAPQIYMDQMACIGPKRPTGGQAAYGVPME